MIMDLSRKDLNHSFSFQSIDDSLTCMITAVMDCLNLHLDHFPQCCALACSILTIRNIKGM